MIDCPNGDVRDALPDYLHDRLDAARRTEVESHLATMRREPAVDIAAIATAIPPYRAPVRRARVTSWRAAAAIAAIAVGGTSIALLSRGREVPADVAPYVRAASASASDTQWTAATPPQSDASVATRATPGKVSAPGIASGELAMAAGAIGELSDGELSALVEGIESLDGLPSIEVEGAEPVSVGAQEAL